MLFPLLSRFPRHGVAQYHQTAAARGTSAQIGMTWPRPHPNGGGESDTPDTSAMDEARHIFAADVADRVACKCPGHPFHVVDVGCGIGKLTNLLHHNVKRLLGTVSGIDTSTESISSAMYRCADIEYCCQCATELEECVEAATLAFVCSTLSPSEQERILAHLMTKVDDIYVLDVDPGALKSTEAASAPIVAVVGGEKILVDQLPPGYAAWWIGSGTATQFAALPSLQERAAFATISQTEGTADNDEEQYEGGRGLALA